MIFHAYFKALLFLAAGAVIHSVFDIQDFRKTGALLNYLPLVFIVFIVGLLSLIGFPFTTGFYSKEAIINSSFYSMNYILYNFTYIFNIMTAIFTIIYSYKFIIQVFFKKTNLSLTNFKHIHFENNLYNIALIIISIITIFIGFFLYKNIYFYNIQINYYDLNIPILIKILPFLFIISLLFIIICIKNKTIVSLKVLEHQYYFNYLYKYFASILINSSYRIFHKIFDFGIIDLFFPIFGFELYNISIYINKIVLNKGIYLHFIPIFIIGLFIVIISL